MRSVLVPLDGTDFAAAILPDARRLAGPGGEIVLMRDVPPATRAQGGDFDPQNGQWAAAEYLRAVAQVLRVEGARVRTDTVTLPDAAVAIDEEVARLGADMVAASTHGRSPADLWSEGSVAWRALLRCTVPVLLRHVDPGAPSDRIGREPQHRRLMVPLDGSELAERAVPLALELAAEWKAQFVLVQVVAGDEDVDEARRYLEETTRSLSGDLLVEVLTGPVVETLARAAASFQVSDIVMTSHGRTAVSRVIAGSVAERLIHEVHCPVVVVPILAALDAASD